ncbi:MAG: L-aspartate oxidase [Armatimonadetes bacterium]|nr:L-aspartate oxidase [Armatimonadota bacterium]
MFSRYLTNFDPATSETRTYDFLVVGSGIAGLWSALEAADHGTVAVVTKGPLEEGSTKYAQGGIAAALCPQDSPALHLQDTMVAGAGLCNQEAVSILVTEGPTRVRELVKRGAQFDEENGQLILAREGAHGIRRIVRAKGDQTGKEVERALVEDIRHNPVDLYEGYFAVDLLTQGEECVGMLTWSIAEQRFVLFIASTTLLATGGAGQLFKVTTNPAVVTGDGMAMAYRAGAWLQDMEFMQFHPTALAKDASPKFLISEAVRGEGARLVNTIGHRFMPDYHPDAELAPRDVVSRSIVAEMQKTGSPHVLLDLTSHSRESIQGRFPTIFQTCCDYGIDPSDELIPVSPAAHYTMGGVRTGLNGETNLKRLYACGEVACTGVHGANRLASNSLLEGLVFGSRSVKAARRAVKHLGAPQVALSPVRRLRPYQEDVGCVETRRTLRNLMWSQVGLLRSEEALVGALDQIDRMAEVVHQLPARPETWELANMVLLSRLIAFAALVRTESRGAHQREDFPKVDDVHWKKHAALHRRTGDGVTIEDDPEISFA